MTARLNRPFARFFDRRSSANTRTRLHLETLEDRNLPSVVPLSLTHGQEEALFLYLNETIGNARPFFQLLHQERQLALQIGAPTLAASFQQQLDFFRSHPFPTVEEVINEVSQTINVGNQLDATEPALGAEFAYLESQQTVDITSIAPIVGGLTTLLGAFPSSSSGISTGGRLLTNGLFFVSLAETLGPFTQDSGSLSVDFGLQTSTVTSGAFQSSFQIDAPESGQVSFQVINEAGAASGEVVIVLNSAGDILAQGFGTVSFSVEANQSYTAVVSGISLTPSVVGLSTLFLHSSLNPSAPQLESFLKSDSPGVLQTPLSPNGPRLVPVALGATDNTSVTIGTPNLSVSNASGDESEERSAEEEMRPLVEETSLFPGYVGQWIRTVRIEVPWGAHPEGSSPFDTHSEPLGHPAQAPKPVPEIVPQSTLVVGAPKETEPSQRPPARVEITPETIVPIFQAPESSQKGQAPDSIPESQTSSPIQDDYSEEEGGVTDGILLDEE
jgi:hypothetical protein